MRKRGFLLITACILAVGMLAGCGNGSGQEESKIQSNIETAPENESSPATTEEDSAEVQIDDDETEGKTLVVYFSATGNTKNVAEVIAETTGGELFELEPLVPYTDDDLNYNDDNSRTSQEYADESLRNVELVADTVDDWQDVERVYIGYPLWWGIAAWPVNTFVEANDFSGKTIAPFVTSGGSGFSNTLSTIASMEPNATVTEGLSLGSSTAADSGSDVTQWLSGIGLME